MHNTHRRLCSFNLDYVICQNVNGNMSFIILIALLAVILDVATALPVKDSFLYGEDTEYWSRTLRGSMSIETDAPTSAPTIQTQPIDCITLTQNTSAALGEAVLLANGENIHLCDTTILFDDELALDVSVNLTCQNDCIFDGRNSTRLFSFGYTIWPDVTSVDFRIYFQNITFQHGRGVPVLEGIGSRQGGGGAFQMRGIEGHSIAIFEDCVFRNNNGTFSHNGGAIDVENGGRIELNRCLFDGNTAHTGGAINAYDILVTIKDTVFRNNDVCGSGEGSAIYLSSDDFESRDIFVECTGSNEFVGNIDGVCIDPALNPGYVEFPHDIVGCTKSCGVAGVPSCRLS